MGFFGPQKPTWGSLVEGSGPFACMSVRRKLLFTIIPLMAVMLAVTGYATKLVSSRYLGMALERTTKVLAMGQADAVGRLFDKAREDVLTLAQGPRGEEEARRFLAVNSVLSPGVYREAGFVSLDGTARWLYVDTGKDIRKADTEHSGRIGNSPLMVPFRLNDPAPGTVGMAGMSEVVYPPGLLEGHGAGVTCAVFRFAAPATDGQGNVRGYWVLSVDARAARDTLSLYNSPSSPLAAFPRTQERRYSFFFDTQGWILFQSGAQEERDQPISTVDARAGLPGDHGMPGFPGAFRPAPGNEAFWRMVVDVQAARTGLEQVDAGMNPTETGPGNYSLGYAPVYFRSAPDKSPEVVGGVAFMDKSRVPLIMNYQVVDMLLAIFVVAMALTALIVYLLSRRITRPVLGLAEAVGRLSPAGELKPVEITCSDRETTILKDSINKLIEEFLEQRAELKIKDARIKDHINRQPHDLSTLATGAAEPMEGLYGDSPAMQDLKRLLRKTSSVDADVLIIGETGTGKEVAAQAIHKLSSRADGPFISINCGALDENLLLDALFGHVKGAFSEAKTDRKGAFQAAQGGTILLDEIGNASPKVQQALLRALAVRAIIPLGHDSEVPFDARVIAATNEDLRECVEAGTFREDLYYRLKVITLHTPPLRDRRDDIPILADAFLKESAKVMNKPAVTLSRGAWERIAGHDWPGNVRELKHCIMRAVAMADTNTLFAEDLRFDSPQPGRGWASPPFGEPSAPARRDGTPVQWGNEGPEEVQAPVPEGVNERQLAGLEYVREKGVMSRAQYQAIVGKAIPSRTAQYDLRDLVERGLLLMKGKGPSTRYELPNRRGMGK